MINAKININGLMKYHFLHLHPHPHPHHGSHLQHRHETGKNTVNSTIYLYLFRRSFMTRWHNCALAIGFGLLKRRKRLIWHSIQEILNCLHGFNDNFPITSSYIFVQDDPYYCSIILVFTVQRQFIFVPLVYVLALTRNVNVALKKENYFKYFVLFLLTSVLK